MTDWDTSKVGELMAGNPYEKLAPFRMWFRSDGYQVECSHDPEANQKLRIRSWKGIQLVPLMPQFGSMNIHLAKMHPNLSLYQPYYPETYYDLWELLWEHPALIDQCTSVCAQILDWQTGSLEAIILFMESQRADLSQIIFHEQLLEEPTEDDYLGQTLPISEPSDQSERYHLIYFGGLDQMPSPTDWPEMISEMDRLASIISNGLDRLLEDGGSAIIYLRRSWCQMDHPIWDSLARFRKVQFYRPKISNVANPVTYLIATGFVSKGGLRQELQKPREIARSWRSVCREPLEPYPIGDPSALIEQWHRDYRDPPMVTRELLSGQPPASSYFIPAPSTIHRTGSSLALDPTVQARMNQYAIDLRKQKRVMDTKPSTAHAPSLPSPKREVTWRDWDWNHDEKRAFQQLKQHVRRTFKAEVVTNAWLKMYEIWCAIPELQSIGRINAFHICEAPGAFVAATNHFAFSNEIPYTWRAQTLVASDTSDPSSADTALGDHFGMLASHPDRWLNDPDACYGDITRPETIRYYRSHPDLQKINWISSDAGKQCEVNRLCSQEAIGLDLVLGQVACILACLQPGGHAIYKTFLPLTEEINVSLLALVARSFRGCKICKPASSTSSNSEVYVVLTDYLGPDDLVINQLLRALKIGHRKGWDNVPAPFRIDDPTFFNHLLISATSLIGQQIASLQNVYYRYYLPDEPNSVIRHAKHPRVDHWNRICRPKPLPFVNKLLVARAPNRR